MFSGNGWMHIEISRASMAEWMIRVSELLTPLYDALQQMLVKQPSIQADETPIQVLNRQQPKIPPKSLLGKAMTYLQNQWKYLVRYLVSGLLDIDNNAAQRGIKPFVIGRKNWLFAQSVNGAKAGAVLYSLVETPKANGLEPYL